jgi:endonuclease YncB( thermonuclease family)
VIGWVLVGRLSAGVGLLCALGVGAAVAQESHACAGLSPGPTRTVARVIDGETLALDDGTELRLIGSLAPRAIDVGAEPGTWPLENTTRDALRALVLGKSLELAFGRERTDRYARLLAQAYLIEGGQRRWVQGYLLANGLARAYAFAGASDCAGELLAAEASAREARRGLWGGAAYQVRHSGEPSQLLRYRATFQIVEGRIARVALVRGIIYLNFARNWRRAFSVSLRRGDRALLGPFADDPRALQGRRVRVRGWIGRSRRGNAPVIDLSSGGTLEVIDTERRGAGRGG